MRVAAIQHDIAWQDKAANFAHLEPLLARSAKAGAHLALLPEMFATGFSMDTASVAEGRDGPTTAFLRGQAARHGVAIGGSFACLPRAGDRPVNRFLLARPDGTTVHYDKVHPFSFGGEDAHYAAGSEPVTFALDGCSLTPFVCYDLRFADWFWAAATRTDCYLVVANWPASREEHWSTLLRARAIENQAYVVGVNRVGDGGGIHYAGASVVVDPFGLVVAAAGASEEVLLAECDPARVAEVRARYPFLADR